MSRTLARGFLLVVLALTMALASLAPVRAALDVTMEHHGCGHAHDAVVASASSAPDDGCCTTDSTQSCCAVVCAVAPGLLPVVAAAPGVTAAGGRFPEPVALVGHANAPPIRPPIQLV